MVNIDFSIVNSIFVHCLRTHKYQFLTIFLLKMGLTVLFTHLKFILLQCFHFLIFNFSKISFIQTYPKYGSFLNYGSVASVYGQLRVAGLGLLPVFFIRVLLFLV